MGRFWLGLGILLCLLTVGLLVNFFMDNNQTSAARDLEQAAALTLQGDTETAFRLAQKARAAWDRGWRSTASLSDHAPMDEIDSLFAVLDTYRKTGNREEFAAYCVRIAMLIRAVSEAHDLTWWNLL